MKKLLVALFVLMNYYSFSQTEILANDPAIVYSGRIDFLNPESILFSHTGVRIRTMFEGTSIEAKVCSLDDDNYFVAIVDGMQLPKLHLPKGATSLKIASGLSNSTHTLELVKVTECLLGRVTFDGFVLDKGKALVEGTPRELRNIHFIGNSITCGYGIEAESSNEHFEAKTENFYEGYAAITARVLNADYTVIARSGIGVYRNYGESSEGSKDNMRAIYNRVIYDDSSSVRSFAGYSPDVICVNLGTNDYSTNSVNDELFKESYLVFLDTLLAQYPESKIVLLAGPMLNSSLYSNNLKSFVETKNTRKDKRLSFFEMSPQGKLGYGADWHPSKEQARKNTSELVSYLSGLMGWENKAVLQKASLAAVGKKIELYFNEKIDDTIMFAGGFSVKVDGTPVEIDSVYRQNESVLSISITGQIMPLTDISISFVGETGNVFGGKQLAPFQNISVANPLTPTMAHTFECDLASIIIHCNKNIRAGDYAGFSVTNEIGMPIAFDSITMFDNKTLRIHLADSAAGKALLVSYQEGNVLAEDSIPLTSFKNKVAEYLEETGLKRGVTTTDKIKIYPIPLTQDGITIELIEPQFRDVEIRFYTLNGALLFKADIIREKTYIKDLEIKNMVAYATLKGYFSESPYVETIPIMFE